MPSFTVFKGSKDGVVRKSTTTKPDELVGDQVLVKVTASGVCGTDLHYLSQDMVLGHEGVGVVENVAPGVKELKKGDRVGWGYNTDSCGQCMQCASGEEVFCDDRALYGSSNFDQGSFATQGVWREAHLFKIPEGMDDETAAPLQCAGATVYTALMGLRPSETVGIMGVGGLGHLAIMFAAKMGLHVVAISGSDRKKDEARKLGAHDFVAMNSWEPKNLATFPRLDRLLVTTSAQPQWDVILPMMAPRSAIYPLSVSASNLEMPYMPLILQGIRVQGSLVATRRVQREMLAFAALHGIRPLTERFPMTEEGIKEAIGKLESGKLHFRAVLIPQ